MITIEEIFLTLIQEQKKVFLSGIGQFSVERVSAAIHPVTHEMTPPHSTLVFSNTLVGDNTQFVNAVKQLQSISQEDADAKVNQFLSGLNSSLSETKSFTISNVCVVKLISNNNFEVTMNDYVAVDKNDIGLNQVKSEVHTSTPIVITKVEPVVERVEPAKTEPIKEVPVKEIIEKVEPKKEDIINIAPIIMEDQVNSTPEIKNTDTVVAENPQPKKKSNKGIWIFIILLLIAIIAIVGYLFKDDLMTLAGLKSEVKTDTTALVSSDVVADETPVADSSAVVDTVAATIVEPVVEPIIEPVTTPVRNKVSTGEKADLSVIVYAPKDAGKYYVIAMSFKDLGNASKGVKQLKRKGYNPVVIDKNEQGLYRVAYKPGFETERLARDLADDLYEKQNLDPWIVKY